MENEIPSVNRVDEIKDRLRDLEGQRVKVRANMGRSRIVERAGTLVHVPPPSLWSRSRNAAAAPPASPTSTWTS